VPVLLSYFAQRLSPVGTADCESTPSTEVIPQEHAAVSALDAAGNNTVDMLQSEKIHEGMLVVCKPIFFCLLYYANLIMFFVLSQQLQN
jgi:hypothetical protein